MEAVFRRSFWDPSISMPCLTLLTLGGLLMALWPSETYPIALLMIGVGLYRAYSGLRFRYVISSSGVEVFKGGKLSKRITMKDVKASRIRIRGGRVRDVSDAMATSLLLATQRGPGVFLLLDIGTIEFLDREGETILKVKGVNVGRFLESLRKIHGLNRGLEGDNEVSTEIESGLRRA